MHNARSTLRDLEREGPRLFERLKVAPEDRLWYYRSLVDAYGARQPEGDAALLLQELRLVIDRLQRLLDD